MSTSDTPVNLASGTKLGAYEIVEQIGKGGMGEVYKARDPRVGRIVAIKVCHAEFSERFAREAKVIASLNHPNICQLYDVGPNYLVMEYVEGLTLAEVIQKGPIPEEEALNIARQIGAALEHAHDAHEMPVVHRDLKPANIKVKPGGVVKVLDFGLAKVGKTSRSFPALSEDSPTLTMGITEAGMVVGTVHYMSPEQAKGREVDKRADVWSFGVVLYEMLAGARPFPGPDLGEVMAAVIRDEPAWEPIPIRLRRLLKACLAKNAQDRLRDIGDVWKLLETPDALQAIPAPVAHSAARWMWPAAAALFLIAAAAIAIVHFRETPPVQQSVRYQIPLPADASVAVEQVGFRLSPDGRYLAFSALLRGQSYLWVQSLDSLEATRIAGTEGAIYPFWSPDSASVGYFSQGKLKRVATSGGPSQTLCDAAVPRGGTWNRDGVILFSAGPTSPLYRVPASGGTPMEVTKLDASSVAGHRFPEFLPDGRHFVYLASTNNLETTGVFAAALDGGEPVRILPEFSSAIYAAAPGFAGGGLMLFRRADTLMALPFDAGRMKAAGDVFPVIEKVGLAGNTGYGAFAVAGDGVLVLRQGGWASRELVWMDRKGTRLNAVGKPSEVSLWNLSPDETTVALGVGDGTLSNIWLLDVASGAMSRLTFSQGINDYPIWSPDGQSILYSSRPPGLASEALIRKPVRRAGTEEVFKAGTNAAPWSWSPDGRNILFSETRAQSGEDLWLMPLDGQRKATVYLQTAANEIRGRFSPDGRWIAYMSDESGQPQIYVQPVPTNGAKWQISSSGGDDPQWRADGKELYYVGLEQQVMAVGVKTTATSFEAGTPQSLFTAAGIQSLASSRDGQRFMVSVPAGGPAAVAPPWTVLLNWQAGLKK